MSKKRGRGRPSKHQLFGESIEKARNQAGLFQYELADKIGVAQATISNWERGKGSPTGKQLEKLTAILGNLSKGGTSLRAENIQLPCARHNIQKRDKIQ